MRPPGGGGGPRPGGGARPPPPPGGGGNGGEGWRSRTRCQSRQSHRHGGRAVGSRTQRDAFHCASRPSPGTHITSSARSTHAPGHVCPVAARGLKIAPDTNHPRWLDDQTVRKVAEGGRGDVYAIAKHAWDESGREVAGAAGSGGCDAPAATAPPTGGLCGRRRHRRSRALEPRGEVVRFLQVLPYGLGLHHLPRQCRLLHERCRPCD